MRITIFEDSKEMTGYCKMTWLANIRYKVNFFQTHNRNEKIKAYIIISDEEPTSLNDREQLVFDLWKKQDNAKVEGLLKDFQGDAA